MPDSKNVLRVVSEWVSKAEGDLLTAVHTLRLGNECPSDTVCFHAQQCVEKYIKALLVLRGVEFPKTHDVERLLRLLPESAQEILYVAEQRELTRYATVTRYPGTYDPIPLAEARRAVKVAQSVRAYIRKMLPKEVLPRKRC